MNKIAEEIKVQPSISKKRYASHSLTNSEAGTLKIQKQWKLKKENIFWEIFNLGVVHHSHQIHVRSQAFHRNPAGTGELTFYMTINYWKSLETGQVIIIHTSQETKTSHSMRNSHIEVNWCYVSPFSIDIVVWRWKIRNKYIHLYRAKGQSRSTLP